MIEGRLRTEKEYRAIPMDSSSSIKEFSMDRKKYYKKYVLGEKSRDEDDTKASITGKLVECLLWEKDLFDSKFCLSCLVKAPTGLMLAFVEALYKYTAEATDEEGQVTRSFEDMSRDAYKDSGFKIKYEAVLEKFVGNDPELYYRELLDIRGRGLTVVTVDDVTNAERIVEELKTNDVTSHIVNQQNDNRFKVFIQLQIEGYQVFELDIKSMLDIVIVDTVKKIIYIYDLKCVWSVEGFTEDYYLYRRAYFQGYLYHYAVKHWAKDNYPGYKVELTKFIVSDSINYFHPLIYEMYPEDMTDAVEGFDYKGRTYPGLKETIEDLKWAKENNIWNISRKNYINKGIVRLKP